MIPLLPRDLDEACVLLRESIDPETGARATPLAGGTDLCVNWHTNSVGSTRHYLDLSALSSLRSMQWTEDSLVLGALTTYWDAITDVRVQQEFPLLVRAARQVGAVQIQTRGTWAGNIANASPAADGVPVLMAYGGQVELTSTDGSRWVPLDEFYLGYKESVRRPDELITHIRLPRQTYGHCLFEKVGLRRAQAITKAGVAVTERDGQWRVVANSVAATVCRCTALETALESGQTISDAAELLTLLRQDVQPIDDLRSTAQYREQVLARVLYYWLAGRAPGVR